MLLVSQLAEVAGLTIISALACSHLSLYRSDPPQDHAQVVTIANERLPFSGSSCQDLESGDGEAAYFPKMASPDPLARDQGGLKVRTVRAQAISSYPSHSGHAFDLQGPLPPTNRELSLPVHVASRTTLLKPLHIAAFS